MKNHLILLLIIAILIQSCKLVYKRPVSLREAYKPHTETLIKVINTHGQKNYFIKIITADSLYYGLILRGDTIELIPSQIKSIYLIDLTKTAEALDWWIN